MKPIKHDQSKYILCPKSKGLARKHIDICSNCRSKKRCKAYKAYVQPYLPLAFFSKTH